MALVVDRFGLGELAAEPERVTGGLSNELWRVRTAGGEFAVKRMVVNADLPDFVANVEAAYAIEQRAWTAGVPMPRPVPDPATGLALARVEGSLFRVHDWVDGDPTGGQVAAAAKLLARIHAAGNRRWAAPPETGWDAGRWGPDLADLARRVSTGPDRILVVDSHRDLDRKNTLRRPDGTLIAIDWDAAGPTGAVHEAVALALDWSDGTPAVFAEAIGAFRQAGDIEIEPGEWVFAGWVAAQGGWLDYNADHRADTPLGGAEVTTTLARLQSVAADLDQLIAALR